MRIILSRKGFDSSNGKCASPIFKDGTLLSLPIPAGPYKGIRYRELFFGEKSYEDIIRCLKPKFTCDLAHLDPDLKRQINAHPDWKPSFGQGGAAQGHLRNKEIKEGDLFLFYGWFKHVNDQGKYELNAKDQQILWGYLQIGEIILQPHLKKHSYRWLDSHPHVQNDYGENNIIYVASERLSFNSNLPGAGRFKYMPASKSRLTLTAPGSSRSVWNLAPCFNEVPISYHSKNSWKDGKFHSAKIGQEFVVEENELVTSWVETLFSELQQHKAIED